MNTYLNLMAFSPYKKEQSQINKKKMYNRGQRKYGTAVLGPRIWLFSAVSVKNLTSLSWKQSKKDQPVK
jgi:hypothetical protein